MYQKELSDIDEAMNAVKEEMLRDLIESLANDQIPEFSSLSTNLD